MSLSLCETSTPVSHTYSPSPQLSADQLTDFEFYLDSVGKMTNQHDKIKSSQDSDIERMEDIVNGIQNLGADVDNMTTEEMHFLNQQMDELNSALDMWERKNDLIYARLVELLDSNRAIREQIKENAQQPSTPEECSKDKPTQ